MAELKQNIKILIVDDVEANRFVLRNIISDMGYQPILAENGPQALKVVSVARPNIILLDISMPDMDGYEVCAELKSNVDTKDIPVIFISAYDENDDIVKGFEVGGEDYIVKPFVREVVERRVNVRLTLAEQTEKLANLNHQLVTLVNQQKNQIEEEKKTVLYALANVARENAHYEDAYMQRVQTNCNILAQAMQLSPEFESRISDNFIEAVSLAAPLCDLGNVAITTSILQKHGALDADETIEMQKHTTIGGKILEDIKREGSHNEFISTAIDICKYHHENYDGSGYPEGLEGAAIPLSAQIVKCAGVYTSLTEARDYRDAYSSDEAIEIMSKDSGATYNSQIFDILKKIYRQFQ